MKKLFSKTVAALLSVACVGSLMTASFDGEPLLTANLTVEAAECSCVYFDEITGTIILNGEIKNDSLKPFVNNKNVKKVVANEGTILPENSSRLFSYILAETIDLSKADASNIIYAYLMFDHCVNLNNLVLGDFNTSNVIHMTSMFNSCRSLETLDLSSFNTSKVQIMDHMFYCCWKLKSLDLSNFDTSNVLTMSEMFSGCWALETLDISSFDTRKVSGMGGMFSNCTSLKTINVSSFDTSNVISMKDMFRNCYSIKRLDLSNFNTSNVNRMDFMFDGCSTLESIDLNSFNTSNVNNMEHMFNGCLYLNTVDLNRFDTSKVRNMQYMFSKCMKMDTLDISSFDTSNVVMTRGMFNECVRLKTIYVSDKWSISSILNSDNMFYNCNELVGGYGTVHKNNPYYNDYSYARIDKKDRPGFFTEKTNDLETLEKIFDMVDNNNAIEKNVFIGLSEDAIEFINQLLSEGVSTDVVKQIISKLFSTGISLAEAVKASDEATKRYEERIIQNPEASEYDKQVEEALKSGNKFIAWASFFLSYLGVEGKIQKKELEVIGKGLNNILDAYEQRHDYIESQGIES